MVVSYIQTKDIFKELPVGYYCGRKIKHRLSETDKNSYYNCLQDAIVVSYPTIASTLETIEEELSHEQIESVIRGLLYHELSHAIFTPKSMKPTRTLNIFEDERIETINKNTFMNVDFKKNIYLLNNFHGEEPKTAEQAFYHLVRYHQVKDKKWIDEMFHIIRRYRRLTANSSCSDFTYYMDAVNSFHDRFVAEWEKEKEEEKSTSDDFMDDTFPESTSDDSTDDTSSDSTNSESEETESISISSKSDSDDTSDESDDTSSFKSKNSEDTSEDTESKGSSTEEETTEDYKDPYDDIFNGLSLTSDEFKTYVNNIINMYYNKNLTDKLRVIIAQKLKQNKKNGSAISSYSGKFNVRAVGTRDDYKWWSQSNREGHIKRFSKVHMNLFIDNSGSFRDNDRAINTLIRSLDMIEKEFPNFDFDIITINTKVVEWKTHNELFQSHGGNCLTNDIAKVIKKHQNSNSNNYNIVLFDGDAHSDEPGSYTREMMAVLGTKDDPFKNFNFANTIIISDYANEKYITPSVSKARVIYTHDYCAMLYKNICTLLEKVV